MTRDCGFVFLLPHSYRAVHRKSRIPIALLLLVIVLLVSVAHGRDSDNGRRFENVELNEELLLLLPKFELHAHLSGSLRRSTLNELAQKKNLSQVLDCVWEEDADHCFKLYSVVHQVISSQAVLRRILGEILVDFMEQNVIYTELRSTPRALDDDETDREGYMQLLVDLVRSHNEVHGNRMMVKLIFSVDRSKSLKDGEETLAFAVQHVRQAALEQTKPIVVGIDFRCCYAFIDRHFEPLSTSSHLSQR